MARFHVLVILSLFIFTGCSKEEPKSSAGGGMPPAAVATAMPVAGDMKEGIHVIGSLAASESALIRSEIAGILTEVAIKDGQAVKKGQMLFRINHDSLMADLQRAKADVKLREQEKQRMEDLFKRRVNSQYDVDKAVAQLETAKANLALAKSELSKASITAPFAGNLGIRKVNQGGYIQPGQELIELVQLNPLYVDFSIPETTLTAISKGTTVDVLVSAVSQETIQAKVTAIEPLVNANTRSVAVRALINNDDKKLRPGLFAKVLLPLKTAEDILWLPEKAIFLNAGKTWVVVNNDGKSKRKQVSIISYQNGKVAIEKGIAADDEVVVAGHHKVPFDGMPLMVVEGPDKKQDSEKTQEETTDANQKDKQ